MSIKRFKRFVFIIILVVLLTTTLVSKASGGECVTANNRFTLELYQQMKNEGENIIMSPFSVFNAFAMLYSGSDGSTKQEISQTLHFEEDKDYFLEEIVHLQEQFKPFRETETAALNIANSLWAQEGYRVLETYLAILQDYFQSDIRSVDFSDSVKTAGEINSWLSKKTHGKINKIITPNRLNTLTTLIVANAIYFKGAWMNPFLEKNTKRDLFFSSPAKEIQVEMMTNKKSYRYEEHEGFKMLEMPYRKEYNEQGEAISKADYAMIVFLPDKESSLEAFENQLDYPTLNSHIESLIRSNPVQVDVKIPKFRTENTYNLNDPLMALGMQNAFSSDADFSTITGQKDLFISDVIHKTYIDVDEKGTEAAAVTAIIMARGTLPRPDAKVNQFHADRPFMYLIRENRTGSIIFIGKVTKPES